jgi:FtsP/CotA-like multicopper oxidase with cupredoxin domain
VIGSVLGQQVRVSPADYAGASSTIHCHLIFHEDRGMMGQYTVVEPGQRVSGHH